MDERKLEEVGKHLDAIANAIAWAFVVVYLSAVWISSWLLWD
jgi:hypothetical protein